MTSQKIAFQGVHGAYSELAAQKFLPGAEALPKESFEDVFSALSNNEVNFAAIPVENSIAGRVADIHHLLPRGDYYIIAEHYEPILHQLLAPRGATIATIKEVHSHVHALGQCRNFIRTQGFSPIVHADTAGAARDVSEWNNPSKAAIGSKLAAELYGLEILESNVADEAHNTTRFLLLAKAPKIPALGEEVITTIFFTLRSVPAALYKAIGGFATNGINLTKIESYVTGPHFSIAQFHIDVEGHPESTEMKHALEELRFFSTEVKLVGTYPAHPFRRNGATS
jgi:prephenate dehydratase